MKETYDIKGLSSWPHRLISFMKGITSKFQTVTGRMNQDGIVYPVNDPVLIAKFDVTTIHTSIGHEEVVSLHEDIGIPNGELGACYVDVTVCLGAAGVSVPGDDAVLSVDDAALTDFIQRVVIADPGGVSATKSFDQPSRLFPDPSHDRITLSSPGWTTGTENWRVVGYVYRIPSAVVIS